MREEKRKLDGVSLGFGLFMIIVVIGILFFLAFTCGIKGVFLTFWEGKNYNCEHKIVPHTPKVPQVKI